MRKKSKIYTKNCPSCGIEQKYSRSDSLCVAIKNNTKCNNCAGLGRKLSKSHKNKISNSLKNRIPWNKGLNKDNNPIMKKISDKQRGRIISDETKTKISNFQQEYWNDERREQHSTLLKNSDTFMNSYTEERSLKISNSNKNSKKVQKSIEKAVRISSKNRTGKTYEEIYGDELANKLKIKRREQAIKQNTDITNLFGTGCSLKRNTKPELAVEKLLKIKNIKYNKQYPIWSSYPLTKKVVKFYDFYLPEYKIIIEVHGDYWHANPNYYNINELDDIQIQTKVNDTHKLQIALNSKKVNSVFYIWETETKNKDILDEKISKILQTDN